MPQDPLMPPQDPSGMPLSVLDFLAQLSAPNITSLLKGEPAPPIPPMPATPGKVPSTDDPRQGQAIIEALQMAAPAGAGMGMAGRLAAPAARMAAPTAARGASSVAPAMLAEAGMAGAMGSTPAAAEGAPEEVPVGSRPQTGEWWRTRRAPAPTPPPFVPPAMTRDELSVYDEPEWKPPKGWQGDREQRQPNEGPVAHAKRVADLREQRALRETRRTSASENKAAVARKEWEAAQASAMKEYEKEQERLDKEDAQYKEANENFRRKHPALATALPIIGAGAGAAIPYANRVRLLRINNKLVSDVDKAIERAEEAAKGIPKPATGSKAEKAVANAEKAAIKSEKAGAATDLSNRLDPKAPIGLARSRHVDPGVGSQIGGVATGALGSVEGAIFPYEMDLALPIDSPDRREAADFSNWLARGEQQLLPGGLAGHVGMHAPLPRRGLVPDIERAQGLIRRLQQPAAPKPPVRPAQVTPQQQIQMIEQALAAQGKTP